MRFDILTLFPEVIDAVLGSSIIGRAKQNGYITVNSHIKHKSGTGAGNERIIENLSRLAKTGKLFEVRTPIIPGFNDSAEDVKSINDIIKGFGGNIKHTLLPFHNICASKYEAQGRKFEAADIPEPTKDKMTELNSLINGG